MRKLPTRRRPRPRDSPPSTGLKHLIVGSGPDKRTFHGVSSTPKMCCLAATTHNTRRDLRQ